MPQDNNQDKVIDFSNYFGEKQPQQQPEIQQQIYVENEQDINNDPTVKRRKKIIRIAIVIIILLSAAEAIFLISLNRNNKPEVPDGYEFVQPINAPPNIRPIK